jgi:signal transduction histidine kinase/CheY-like chemotaxis protein
MRFCRYFVVLSCLLFLAVPVLLLSSAQPVKLKVGIPTPEAISTGKRINDTGIHFDILKAVAIEENWKLEPKFEPLESCYKDLVEGNIDLILNISEVTGYNDKLQFTTEPIIFEWDALILRKDAVFSSIFDISRKKIGVIPSRPGTSELSGLTEKLGVSWEKFEYPDHLSALKALNKKEVFAVLAPVNELSNLKHEKKIKVTDLLFSPANLGYATLKGHNDKVLKKLNHFVKKIKSGENSVFSKLKKKNAQRNRARKIPYFFKWLLAFLLTLAMAFLGKGLLLEREVLFGKRKLEEKDLKSNWFNEAMPVGLAIYKVNYDLEGEPEDLTYFLANPEYQRIFELSDPSGKTFTEVWGKPEFQVWHSFFTKNWTQKRTFDFDRPYILRKNKWFSGRVLVLDSKTIAVFIKDETQQRFQKQLLEKSEKQFRRLFYSMPAAILLFSRKSKSDFQIIEGNAGAEKLFKSSSGTLGGSKLSEVFPKNYKYLSHKLVRSPGGKASSPFRLDYNSNFYQVTTFLAGTNMYVGIFEDITENLAKKIMLSESKLEEKAVLQRMKDWLFFVNKDLEIIWANSSSMEYFKLEPGEVKQKKCSDLICGKKSACDKCPVKQAFATGDYQFDEIVDAKTGHILSIAVSPQFGEHQEIDRVLLAVTDITELQQREIKERQAQKMELVGKLVGGVAHDFNNILQAIIGFSDILHPLLEEKSEEEELLKEIASAGNRGRNLVKQMMFFSRKEEFKPQRLELNTHLANLMKMLHRLIGENYKLNFAKASRELWVKADPTQLDQVFINLCVNAKDAIEHEDGKISIKVFSQQNAEGNLVACVAVKDNGKGIPVELQRKVFEPFFTTKAAGKGTGMGLASVHGIIKRHGGLIEVESEEGSGTEFKICLEIIGDKEREVLTDNQKMDSILGKFKGVRVLLVEDEIEVRKLTARMLKKLGCSVSSCGTGEEALELFAKDSSNFDLLLLDVVLPGINGSKCFKEMKKINSNVPVIFYTGYTTEDLPTEFLDRNRADLLIKPFTLKDLAQRLSRTLNQEKVVSISRLSDLG